MASTDILDVRRVKAIARDYGKSTLDQRAQAMLRALGELEALSVELAPVADGNLEGSTVVEVTQNTRQRTRGEVAFNTPYAAFQHEGVDFNYGPETLAKPGNELGPPGAKYLERALREMQRGRFLEIVAEEIKNA